MKRLAEMNDVNILRRMIRLLVAENCLLRAQNRRLRRLCGDDSPEIEKSMPMFTEEA